MRACPFCGGEGLGSDRAPVGSPVTGLLMACRARFGREHWNIGVQRPLDAVTAGAIISVLSVEVVPGLHPSQ